MLQDLIIFQKVYDLILWIYPIISRFPQKQRFVLGQQIQNELLDILKNIIEANQTTQKSPLFQKISVELDQFRILLRLSKDLHFVSIKQYQIAAEKINEIGRILNGWIKKFS